jgi:hypothetical protein
MIWQVGKGDKVKIGLDPWIGSKGLHKLPPQLIQEIRSKGFYTLRQIVKWERSTNWQQQWLTWEEIGLGEDLDEAWKTYTDALKDNNVKIREDDDQLLWSLDPTRTYVPKLGYKALTEEGRDKVWWWRTIWKLRCPSKNKIFMWLILKNRFPT